MGAFLGCCVIAAVIFYVGRKIARVLYGMSLVAENFAARSVDDWPTREEARKAMRGE